VARSAFQNRYSDTTSTPNSTTDTAETVPTSCVNIGSRGALRVPAREASGERYQAPRVELACPDGSGQDLGIG
jgi:hypothetical protein